MDAAASDQTFKIGDTQDGPGNIISFCLALAAQPEYGVRVRVRIGVRVSVSVALVLGLGKGSFVLLASLGKR